ncbi:MAG: HAD hydrolase family protein [Methylococcales bacterium]
MFLDLDDTVFQTLRKCPRTDDLLPVAFLPGGEPVSYCTSRQVRLIELLAEAWRIIPTTARNREAFSRVKLPVACREGAILNHGAMIIDNRGVPDPVWHSRILARLAPHRPCFAPIEQNIQAFAQQRKISLKIRVIQEGEEPFYLVIKHRQADFDALIAVRDQCVKPLLSGLAVEFYLHSNDNNLAILPGPVNKAYAVTYLMEQLRLRYGEVMTLGMGDSLADMHFMALCDYVMIPGRTQLHAALCAGV